ncbi:positive regulator of sigma E activity [Chryseobacterium ginsenosidimutans]|uniref:hypothetical protein n=1 Tax=Chryseobacterium ginsenosidimutans TaxID=687846 RepID=UPI0027844F80|nr:hypothetical protein [Chryseobacterium ginsenosidimutans]MDQ0592275.1 positive regulator of sigma E activity [Chryseobacterium ginsenosidimutans]
MKTILKNQHTITNQILLAIVSSTFGYNLYQAIINPEKSHLILSIILLLFTYFMVEKYGTKIEQKKEKI